MSYVFYASLYRLMDPEESLVEKHSAFIVLEGIDGAGTTTQGDLLTDLIQRRLGRKVFFTNEPSNGPVGMLIRLALSGRLIGKYPRLHGHEENPADAPALDPHTMALLFAADRADHLATKIEPNLARGRIVICDRYILSSLAYQGVELPLDWLLDLNCRFRKPDLTIYVDVPPNHATERMRSARWSKDLYEDEGKLTDVRHLFLDLIRAENPLLGPIVRIDGTAGVKRLSSEIGKFVLDFLQSGRTDVSQGQLFSL